MAAHFAHMCGFVWEWTQAKINQPFDTPAEHFGFFGGQQKQKSGKANKRLDRLAPNLVHVGGFIWEWKQLDPRYPRGIGVKNAKVWKSYQTAGPIGTKCGRHLWLVRVSKDK